MERQGILVRDFTIDKCASVRHLDIVNNYKMRDIALCR